MNLQQFIHENSELSNQQIVDALSEKVEISRDSTPYTWSGITEKLVMHGVPPTELVQLMSGIDQLPGGSVLDKCLSSGGFDFSNDVNRATIKSFEVNEPEWAVNVLNAMLAIGAPKMATKSELYGIELLSVEGVAAERKRMKSLADKTRLMNDVVNAMVSDDTKTIDELKTAIAAWS